MVWAHAAACHPKKVKMYRKKETGTRALWGQDRPRNRSQRQNSTIISVSAPGSIANKK
jgi:hypothetical protein